VDQPRAADRVHDRRGGQRRAAGGVRGRDRPPRDAGMSSTLEQDPRVIAELGGLRGLLAEDRRRLGSGDVGQLPVMVSLVVIATIFQVMSDGRFLTPFNLVNLTLQMAAGGTISIGLVMVLLLGEIDLSAGVVSGMCAAVMAVRSVEE